MTSTDLQNEILIALSRGSNRLFRFNSGQAWAGEIVQRSPTRLVLSQYYPVKLGPPGYPDLSGWSGYQVTQADVGRVLAVYSGVEVKWGRDRVRPQQEEFIDLVLSCGGRAGIARSVEDARAIIAGKNTPGD